MRRWRRLQSYRLCFVLLASSFQVALGFLELIEPDWSEAEQEEAEFPVSYANWSVTTTVEGYVMEVDKVPKTVVSGVGIWLVNASSFKGNLSDLANVSAAHAATALVVFPSDNLSLVNQSDVQIPVVGIESDLGDLLSTTISDSRCQGVRDRCVKVHIDVHPVGWMDCALLGPLKLSLEIVCPLWWLTLFLWCLNTWKFQAQNSNELHHFMTLCPALKSVDSLISWLFWRACPWTDPSSQYLFMSYMALGAVYQTIFYAALILVAKGWLLTRGSLTHKERVKMTCLVVLVYIVVSANYVSPRTTQPLLFFLIASLAFVTLLYSHRNVKTLREQLLFSIANNIDTFQDAIQLKLQMYRVLFGLCLIYFAAKTGLLIIVLFPDQVMISDIGTGFLELMMFCGLAITFRARTALAGFGIVRPPGQGERIVPLNICALSDATEPLTSNDAREDLELASSPMVLVINPCRREGPYDFMLGKRT